MCTVNELRCKEVINIKDGQRLGFADDIRFDPVSGAVTALVVPGPAKLFGLFGKEGDYIIPWCNIQKIGSDIILVSFEVPCRADGERTGGFFTSFLK